MELEVDFSQLFINVAVNSKANNCKPKIHISIFLFLSQAATNDEKHIYRLHSAHIKTRAGLKIKLLVEHY